MADITILYFAWVRERIGLDEEQQPVPSPDTTVAQLLDALSAGSAGHAAAFADRGRLRAALDQKFVPLDTAIGQARELAMFPPVTGG
ncbi:MULTISPECIES: molybdopterin converting factor subunit 1 [unclassified Sphingobium]|uniref:molybdopterin converting factor subunit 1 n=1 Tax=unclassified Sphingobium TaxID=2611147 RepID=UPI00222463FF|nr:MULTISPECIES: molybdopterin converting factor subunit 1 [unclassified Sphingobium]MCW2412751.1 molybdopterin synthase sulfur carrier subunit [Sphingobium sp. B8D3D]MCW2414951.1 molybdopterin synthase sulfur carrier subunit [Sphingobium sp. B8D3A]